MRLNLKHRKMKDYSINDIEVSISQYGKDHLEPCLIHQHKVQLNSRVKFFKNHSLGKLE